MNRRRSAAALATTASPALALGLGSTAQAATAQADVRRDVATALTAVQGSSKQLGTGSSKATTVAANAKPEQIAGAVAADLVLGVVLGSLFSTVYSTIAKKL